MLTASVGLAQARPKYQSLLQIWYWRPSRRINNQQQKALGLHVHEPVNTHYGYNCTQCRMSKNSNVAQLDTTPKVHIGSDHSSSLQLSANALVGLSKVANVDIRLLSQAVQLVTLSVQFTSHIRSYPFQVRQHVTHCPVWVSVCVWGRDVSWDYYYMPGSSLSCTSGSNKEFQVGWCWYSVWKYIDGTKHHSDNTWRVPV